MNRSVRFPDGLEARIRAEAVRLERSFNWVVVKTLERALSEKVPSAGGLQGDSQPGASVSRREGSPSSSSASSRASLAIPGVVRGSSLAKEGVKPVPKQK